MKNLFNPTYFVKSIYDITPDFLIKRGIFGVVLDVDNTLCLYSCKEPEEKTLNFIGSLKKAGVAAVILSNGAGPRISAYAEKLGIEAMTRSMKPRGKGFLWAQGKLGLPKEKVAVIGDQIFTDIYGGNRFGFKTILTEPFDPCEPAFVKAKRGLERFVRRG